MSNLMVLPIVIGLVAITAGLVSISYAIRYVGDQIKQLVIKNEINTIDEIKNTVDYLSELSKNMSNNNSNSELKKWPGAN